jgi:hypothetical protein
MAVLRQGAMLKTEIINRLGAKHGFTRYLEICTPTTGIRYGEVDRRQFTVCSRLMYRWCPEVSDGFKIDYPVLGEAIEPVIADLQGQGLRYDVILVDPWHGYEASLRDMHLALSVLSEGGVLVVHDCSPQSLDLAGPSFVGGCWCGMTYAALIDFVAGEPDLDIYTVDTDYGCAVLTKRPPAAVLGNASRPDPEALKGWKAIGADFRDRFRFFDAHRGELLNLVTIPEFLEREGVPTPKRRGPRAWARRQNELFLKCSLLWSKFIPPRKGGSDGLVGRG